MISNGTPIYNMLNKSNKGKYKNILEAATDVFLEQGYINANMGEIVKRTGGSLSTVYKIFKNKETLFAEVLYSHSSYMKNSFLSSMNNNEDNIEKFLYDVAKNFLNIITQPKTISFYRLLITDGYKNHSEIGKICLEAVNGYSSILSNHLNKFGIESEDLDLACKKFLESSKEPIFTFLVFGLNDLITEDITKSNIKLSVKLFMNYIN